MAPLCPETISERLKDLNQWGCYKLEVVGDKKTKVPYNATTGNRASSVDPVTWVSFNAARAAYTDFELYDGICFFLTLESGLVFIDLDNSISKDGSIMPWAREIIERFSSFTEVSQSGKGLHILIDATKPGARCRRAAYPHALEIYDHARQACITGDVLEGYTTIEHRQDALDKLYLEIFGKEQPHQAGTAPGKSCLSDELVILKATLAKNGKDFEGLWKGSLLGYTNPDTGKPDESAADIALMNHLAFYCCGDKSQMERVFSASALGKRAKWRDRADYRERTINKAIEGRTEFYKPKADETEEERHSREHAEETEVKNDDNLKGAEISEEEFAAYSLPEGPGFECNLPSDHFIQRFMAYGSDISDAYPDYWFAGGLYALAVVADKKIKVNLRQGTAYPNMYVAILGKSSLSRKSTVVDKAEYVLCQVLPCLLPALVPTEFSAEAFTEHMSDHNHASWIRDEAAGVLSLMKRDYLRGFKDTLMQLYDCKPFYRKLRTSQRKSTRTEFRVEDPYLNVFFATTDASLGANTEQNDTLSGFLARFLFFFPQGKKTKWLPLEEGIAQNSIFEEAVRGQLSSIAGKIGDLSECTAMHFSPDAAAYYTEWQRIREEEWTASNDGNAMQIYSRLAPMVTKLGMLFELGSPDFDVTRPIRAAFIMEACRLVDSYLLPSARAVYDLVGANAEKNAIDKIVAYLKKHNGKATKKEILRDIKIKSVEFTDYLETMIESGAVEIKMVKRSGKGRDTLYVFLLSQAKVGYVATVANVAIIAKVEEIPFDNIEGKSSTLATLATMDTLPIVATIENGDKTGVVNEREDDSLSPAPTMRRIDRPTSGKCAMPMNKVVAVYILADRARYKKDEIVGIEVQGEFSVLPGICRLLGCGECRSAIKGDPPTCDPCHWQSKRLGRAEA